MIQQVASPPFQMDIRIAESPVVGMRFLLDGRATDLDAMAAQLEGFVGGAVQQRAEVRTLLRRNEEQRRTLLAEIATTPRHLIEESFSEGLTLCAELGAVEERIAGLRLRIEGLRQEISGLHQLSADLATVGGGDLEIDVDATRYSRAVRQLHQWVDEDRDYVVQSIADGPLQQLASAVGSAEVAAKQVEAAVGDEAGDDFARSLAAVASAHDGLLTVVDELRPPSLRGGLAVALRRLVRTVESADGRFVMIGNERPLPAATELTIFRVAQEAVANADRHGRAERVDVVLSLHPERVILVVRDDGEGFDVVATEARLGKTRSHGLIAMRQRTVLEGGTFEVRSMVGGGTEVRASFSR